MTDKEKAIDIINMLSNTIQKMSKNVNKHASDNMFTLPKAKRSDLVKKRDALKRKFKLC